MKKFLQLIFLMCLGMFLCGNIFAQAWSDVVLRENGDTVAIKGYNLSGSYNTIAIAVNGDTTASGERTNPNRIYKTLPGEVYISDITCVFDVSIPFVRLVADPAPEGIMPPYHLRSKKSDGTWVKRFFDVHENFYCENQYFCATSTSDDQQDREFSRAYTTGARQEMNNCIFELSDWVYMIPMTRGCTFDYKNCKFINVGHEATLEKGIVLETRTAPPDSVMFENCTFLNGLTPLMSLNQSSPSYVYFNHNTIVNAAQGPLHFAMAAEMIVTNNLFVNTNMIPDYPNFYPLIMDEDNLPKGIVNIDTMELFHDTLYWNGEYPLAYNDRRVLFDKNSAWWDPRLADMVADSMASIPEELCPGGCTWSNQMILMNDRTKAFFDDDANYPYLTEGTNITIQPDFANNTDLIPRWIRYVVSNCKPGAPGGGAKMPWWRTNESSNIFIADWPMLANLSYTDATLKSAGYYGLPLGDLNWFPDAKTTWEGKGEQNVLIAALQAGELPAGINKNITTSGLKFSVYPNPFSKATNVEYELNSKENVKLIIYNLAGEKVRSIDLGYQSKGSHNIMIEKGNLNPGMYILQIMTDNLNGMTTKITVN